MLVIRRFRRIVKGLEKIRKSFGFELVYPVYPRARKLLKKFGLEPSARQTKTDFKEGLKRTMNGTKARVKQ
jgi:hypothetical protein